MGMAVPRETPGHPIAPAALILPIPTALTMGMVVGTPTHTDEGQWDQNPLSVGPNLQLTPDNLGFAGGAPGVGQVGNNRTHSQRGLPSPPAFSQGRGGQLVPPITSLWGARKGGDPWGSGAETWQTHSLGQLQGVQAAAQPQLRTAHTYWRLSAGRIACRHPHPLLPSSSLSARRKLRHSGVARLHPCPCPPNCRLPQGSAGTAWGGGEPWPPHSSHPTLCRQPLAWGGPGATPPSFAFQRHREPADADDLDPG